MSKINNKVSSWLAAAALFIGTATTSNAQILWGSGSTNTQADSVGRFIGTTTSNNMFGWWSENFTTTTGTQRVTWESTKNTSSTYSTINTTYDLVSRTSADGMALFNSDYYYSTYGVAPQHASLKMDGAYSFSLAGYEGIPIVAKFNTSMYEFESDSIYLIMSVNGGLSWPIKIDLKSYASFTPNSATMGTITVPISQHFSGNPTLGNCALGFVFKGDSYHWLIDDLRIEVASEYDLTISGKTSGSTWADDFTTARVANAYIQPLNQVSADEYLMGARVLNNGTLDITSALNPRINLNIEKYNGSTWDAEYTETLAIDSTITAGGRQFNYAFLDELTTTWLPTSEGAYRATYTVAHDGTDGSTDGDTAVHYFEISDNNGIYSKAQLAADGFPFSSNAIGGASIAETGTLTGYEWGSMFYFPNGSQTILDSVSIRAYSTNSAASFTAGQVSIRVYKFNDYNNDGLDQDPSVNNELQLIGIGSVDITSTSTGLKTGKTVISNVTDATALKLEDNTTYYISMSQDNSNGLVNTNNQNTAFYYGIDDQLDYSYQAPLMTASPSVLRVSEKVGNTITDKWYGIGFGTDVVPSLMLHLADTIVSVNETVNINNLSVYPNPATQDLNISIDLEKASDVQYIMTDINGRVVRIANKANIQNEVITFDINDLATGVYTVTVKSDKGISTQKFVKK